MAMIDKLNQLLSNLPNFFYKEIGGNVYRIMSAVGNEIQVSEDDISEIKDQINVSTAYGEGLDKHAPTFGLTRNSGESDLAFRQRILASYVRPQVTKHRLIQVIKELSDTTPEIEEYILDRWFLGGNVTVPRITESIQSSGTFYLSGNVQENDVSFIYKEERQTTDVLTVKTKYNIFDVSGVYLVSDLNKEGVNYYTGGSFTGKTITLGSAVTDPKTKVFIDYSVKNFYKVNIFPFYDTMSTGTNYGSGAIISGNEVISVIPLPGEMQYNVTYVPETTYLTPTSASDFYKSSFVKYNMILRNQNIHNNAGIMWLGESTEHKTTNADKNIFYLKEYDMISFKVWGCEPAYSVKVEYFDDTINHLYKWDTVCDINGISRIGENNRADGQNASERAFTDATFGTQLNTLYSISSVIGVFDKNDYDFSDNLYIEEVIEDVISTNDEYVEVSANIREIVYIHPNLPFYEDTDFWNEGLELGNIFIKNRIYLSKKFFSNNQNLRIKYIKEGSILNEQIVILPNAVTPNEEYIVKYIKNPISDYHNLPFEKLLITGRDDNKYKIEAKISASTIKWGSGYKYGQGYVYGQFDNINTQTVAEVLYESRAAGVKSYVSIRKHQSTFGISVYGSTYYGGWIY